MKEEGKANYPKRRCYKVRPILEAKRLLFSLDVKFYLAFHAEGKKCLSWSQDTQLIVKESTWIVQWRPYLTCGVKIWSRFPMVEVQSSQVAHDVCVHPRH